MSVIERLASSLGHRDEGANIELAKDIAARKDKKAVKELVANLYNKSKDIQNDCIKALYETGTITPALIAPYIDDFAGLLTSKNNRLQWGAMSALSCIVAENPNGIYELLPQIISAADKGSVITKDKTVDILAQLCAIPEYADDAFQLLNEQILHSLVNQLPMYAEKALAVVTDNNKKTLLQTLTAKLMDIEQESKRKRITQVIRKLGK